MPNTRKILIVDDDAELRDALTEQLSLHEEFDAVAVESGAKGRTGCQSRADRPRDHGRRAAGATVLPFGFVSGLWSAPSPPSSARPA